ncbi:unnamed protein product [Clavelina lepadiformis]|uniref:Translation initiation factor eIF2B subunit gamma n=1 Tax=Clavelina lepadiformis TaxID=159417 RepID=A0ABP0G8K3_CLALP
MLIISCDVITQLPLHRLVDAHRLYDSSVTMLLSPSRPAGEAGPGMKVKKKGQHDQREFIGLCPTEQCYHRVLFLFNEADLEEDSLTVRQSLLCDFPRIQVRDELKDAHVYIVKRWIVDYIAHNTSRSSFRSELLPYIVQKQFDRHHKVEPGSLEKSPESVVGVHDTNLNVKDIFTFIKQDEETNIIRDLTLSSHTRADNPISCFAFIYEDGPLVNANNIASYVEANRLVSKAEYVFPSEQSLIHPSSKLHEKSQAGSDSMIGERTSVDEQSIIKRSVIGKDCQIGSSVRISNCILMDRVKVGNGCNLQGSVIADRAIIEEKCEIADSLIGSNKVVTSSSKLNRESIVESSTMMEFD